jgi:hypothetical protein
MYAWFYVTALFTRIENPVRVSNPDRVDVAQNSLSRDENFHCA